MTPSPPTRRVVQVVTRLVESDRPRTTAQLARELGLPRATLTAILAELDAAGWVTRDAERRYRAGAGIPVPRTVDHDGFAVPLQDLVAATGCGATVSRVGTATFTVVAKRHAVERPLPGFEIGSVIPIRYPAGAAVMPWRTVDEQEAWLAARPRPARSLLRSVRVHGYAAFRPHIEHADRMEVLIDLLGAIEPDRLMPELRAQTVRQIGDLTSGVYTDDELEARDSGPISYATAPVFRDGRAEYELQLGVLRAEVSAEDRKGYADELVRAARSMST
ncbi:MarR family transcriptional regulator [Tsukamurella sp. 1534]|uniref:MarR family transcriptional regulator n=1 Tax=Tsukamurella sp. 1534 TaxID=1151061 RepID=UPI0002EF739F|nr:MarR family transcriptional regulator [Tsukamurella sp. 1534]